MTIMSGFLRGLDAFAAHLLLMQREPEAIDVCDAAAAEAALFSAEDEDDPDGDEEDEPSEETSEQLPAAYH